MRSEGPRRWLRARVRTVQAGGLGLLAVVATGCRGALAPAGRGADVVFWLTVGLVALGGVVYVAVVALTVGTLRGRRGEGDVERDTLVTRRYIVWWAVVMPAVVLGVVVVGNISSLLALPSGDDVTIEVAGNQFWWEVRYPDTGFVTANEIHIPTGRDVELHLTSDDVIHSFWIPQLSGKRDLIPGHVNELTIQADEPGRYAGACAEFCGIQHANMRLSVIAHEPDEYEAWSQRWADPLARDLADSARRGQDLFETYSCASCHTVAGTPYDGELGPALTDLYTRSTIGAGTMELTREHLARWVQDAPSIKPGVGMPPLEIPEADVGPLLDYLETLQ